MVSLGSIRGSDAASGEAFRSERLSEPLDGQSGHHAVPNLPTRVDHEESRVRLDFVVESDMGSLVGTGSRRASATLAVWILPSKEVNYETSVFLDIVIVIVIVIVIPKDSKGWHVLVSRGRADRFLEEAHGAGLAEGHVVPPSRPVAENRANGRLDPLTGE